MFSFENIEEDNKELPNQKWSVVFNGRWKFNPDTTWTDMDYSMSDSGKPNYLVSYINNNEPYTLNVTKSLTKQLQVFKVLRTI